MSIRLHCWYEGVKIEVGNYFSKQDVKIQVIEDNIIKELSMYDVDFIDETIIHKDGWNFYRLRYSGIIGTYAVPGYTPLKKHDEINFRVVYIDVNNNNQEIDCTEVFYNNLSLNKELYINWQDFLDIVNTKTQLYGLYILTAPKSCGLSNKYDQDWEVLCINKDVIKANIKKTYKEEETWQDRRPLQQVRKQWWKIPNQT